MKKILLGAVLASTMGVSMAAEVVGFRSLAGSYDINGTSLEATGYKIYGSADLGDGLYLIGSTEHISGSSATEYRKTSKSEVGVTLDIPMGDVSFRGEMKESAVDFITYTVALGLVENYKRNTDQWEYTNEESHSGSALKLGVGIKENLTDNLSFSAGYNKYLLEYNDLNELEAKVSYRVFGDTFVTADYASATIGASDESYNRAGIGLSIGF